MGKGVLGKIRSGVCGLSDAGKDSERFCVLVSRCDKRKWEKFIGSVKLKIENICKKDAILIEYKADQNRAEFASGTNEK